MDLSLFAGSIATWIRIETKPLISVLKYSSPEFQYSLEVKDAHRKTTEKR